MWAKAASAASCATPSARRSASTLPRSRWSSTSTTACTAGGVRKPALNRLSKRGFDYEPERKKTVSHTISAERTSLLSEADHPGGFRAADRFYCAGLMNVRAPQRIGADFLQMQDDYLQDETAAKGITDVADLTPIQPGLYLWQGDITTLKCDAIVNAANSGMTGCYIPEPPLHRQRHSHLCRRGAAPCLCGTDGTAGLSRTHRTGKNHARRSICPAAMCCTRSGRSSTGE